ncbi:A disintegrin and metalloproteinase with thrombospondin motifs 18 [Eumeta japonica]|uniref:A disintegrin and metalloproteinase with thrombospondin motifs 18 n=1 Tax=Eumeta variegata TaxID=151549 RepID=A0A4C1VBY2_EUMVA|nr:A disintegrin and metalloproteinase with thrombospondin motifs 18 [Eumeta japonica]
MKQYLARQTLFCLFRNILDSTNILLQEHLEHFLFDALTDSEKLFLFGDNPNVEFELAHVKHPKRRKRSVIHNDHEDFVNLKKKLDLKLVPRSSFLDPQFLFLKRWSNRTEPILEQRSDEEVDNCFYRSHHAALYLCDDIRGIIRLKDENYYFVHPLPDRFHNELSKPHVIVKRSVEELDNGKENKNHVNTVKCIERARLLDRNISHPEVRMWTKHRRKRHIDTVSSSNNEVYRILDVYRNKTISTFINKLHLNDTQNRQRRAILPAVFVETAVFVDRDLYKHMTVNFPKDTERELVRFVLAMINAVQLLYHDPSLGRPVNFILKRLEILHEDPVSLKRPHDIDRFLSNFCTWQRLENPPGDSDPLHWDHALILTGLDLYVVSKNGKVSSQVVGLAPVAGMCTVTSSCTVNEGRHFESVYVVAHEIGHNLGMRHDGPLADNSCDPSAYIMSPTLGSGKITWSSCSKNYLQKFLDTIQSRCLLDHGNSAGQLDHSAEGILPGERFNADQQCMLKYGGGSRHAGAQNLEDICRDLHCQRERYTWTSHPALEGTKCGNEMCCARGRPIIVEWERDARHSAGLSRSWCRGGDCVERLDTGTGRRGRGAWGRWSDWSECASACLLDDSHAAASTGVAVATRRCNRSRHENGGYCPGHDKKYQSCDAQQCHKVPRMTVRDFVDQICLRAREVDPDLIGTGVQRIESDDVSGACAVWCHTRGGGYKSRGWSLPDGTACSRSRPMFCISGNCQKFSCSSGVDSEFSLRPGDCEWEALQLQTATPHPSAVTKGQWRRAAGSQWRPASGCHYHCITGGAGIRLVRGSSQVNIQLCHPDIKRADMGCTQRKSPYQYATMVCTKYKDRVRRLSGLGMQISPVLDEPDRPCRIACQDEGVQHRFYLVNGQEGWFPLGTACGKQNSSYCISGKCLEFGPDNTPLSETVYTLPLLSSNSTFWRSRHKRSLQHDRITVKATLNQEHLAAIIATLNLTDNSRFTSMYEKEKMHSSALKNGRGK